MGNSGNQRVIAWHVEFENGEIELWPAEAISGVPAFGQFVTPLIAGGKAIEPPEAVEEDERASG